MPKKEDRAAVIVIADENKKPSDYFTPISSTFGSFCALGFYYLTTKGAPMLAVIEAMTANAPQAWLGNNIFITNLRRLYIEKKYIEMFLSAGIAGGFYGPQVLIAIMLSLDSFTVEEKGELKAYSFAAFMGTITFVAGVGIFGMAVLKFAEIISHFLSVAREEIPFFLTADVSSEEKQLRQAQKRMRETVLNNLDISVERLSVLDYEEKNLAELRLNLNALQIEALDEKDFASRIAPFLSLLQTLALSAPRPCYENIPTELSWLGFIVESLLKVGVSFGMVYGSVGYTCAVAQFFMRKLGFLIDESYGIANFLMMPQYILNIMGAVSLVVAAKTILTVWVQYRQWLSNDYKLGGPAMAKLFMLTPFFSTALSFDSGYTATQLLKNHCPSELAFTADAVNLMTLGFNDVFDQKFFALIFPYLIERFGSSEKIQKDRAYLLLGAAIAAFRKRIKFARLDEVKDMLNTNEARWLKEEGFFKKTVFGSHGETVVDADLGLNREPTPVRRTPSVLSRVASGLGLQVATFPAGKRSSNVSASATEGSALLCA